MADPDPAPLLDLNAFGLPRHGEGVGPTTRPDIIAERLQEHTAHEPRSFELEGHRLPIRAIDIEAAVEGDDPFAGLAAIQGVAGDNEQQGARLAHGLAQDGREHVGPDQTRCQSTLGSINDTEGA